MLDQDKSNREIEIKYCGFKPSHEIDALVNALTDELYMESPSDSFLRATFTIRNGAIKGFIQITSVVGKFFAVAEDADFDHLAKKLVHRTKRKLAKWKFQRFLGEEIPTSNVNRGTYPDIHHAI